MSKETADFLAEAIVQRRAILQKDVTEVICSHYAEAEYLFMIFVKTVPHLFEIARLAPNKHIQ